MSLSWEGGRSDIKNVNMSQGGSLGYISTLSSDISAQVSYCGQGLSKVDHGSSGSRIDRVEKLGQRETRWIDAPGLHSAEAIYRQ